MSSNPPRCSFHQKLWVVIFVLKERIKRYAYISTFVLYFFLTNSESFFAQFFSHMYLSVPSLNVQQGIEISFKMLLDAESGGGAIVNLNRWCEFV